nr:translation initiation factor IF-2 subunit gamma [Candidatus Sigynarchaeota archaeon]
MKEAEKLQAEINLGTVGHVDHGKTTLTAALSGQWTDRYSEEVERGISIKLGYADAIIAKCTKCPEPDCYWTKEMIKQECLRQGRKNVNYEACPTCNAPVEFVRKIAFVDAPGHEILMATMLSGASLMDGAMLLVAADEKVPQPQTKEHLAALEILGIDKIVVVQNKIDAVEKERVIENYKQIQNFLMGTSLEHAPIIPISAVFKANLHELLMYIEKTIPTPPRDPEKSTRFFIARSFDVNKPGSEIETLQGGVVGGSIGCGKLKVGDTIEIKPGIKVENSYMELTTTIESISVGGTQMVEEAGPGGLLGIRTKLDPSLTKADGLIGNLVGKKGELPSSTDAVTIDATLMEYVLGTEEKTKVEPLRQGEKLMLSIGTTTTLGTVTNLGKGKVHLSLIRRVCADPEMSVAISRNFNNRWRLVGYGTLLELL